MSGHDKASICEKDTVYLVSDPQKHGLVVSVAKIGSSVKYDVFLDGAMQTFYEGQIAKEAPTPTGDVVGIGTLQNYLTAFQIKNPSVSDLYSLNSARIEFVPYQFRPALKIIKSDSPRILIADSVGVGKTIESGLIIKEIEARTELKNVLIICPKPLVAERKWELEMKRFDEEFVPVNGETLRQIVSDIHRDGEWPERYAKSIIPYSVLGKDLLYGKGGTKRKSNYGLVDLNPAPHFDMVIVDEAHHIRNSSTQAYAAVKYFCDHAEAVVFLTATPLQTSDDDLYTLLNVLRPDVILDKDTFSKMSAPNEYISKAIRAARTGKDGWQEEAAELLAQVNSTEWGNRVICRNPAYHSVLERLSSEGITREQRVQLIYDIEGLHSLSNMINRTRRQDIQDFCVRHSFTLESSFTEYQKVLHDELLEFEATVLAMLHGTKSVKFMMTTIMRQAASCIFGLAPFIKGIVNRRFSQMYDDPEFDYDDIPEEGVDAISSLSGHIIELAENLSDEDPKFDAMVEVIEEKALQKNNKIIIFSTFRHTLGYLRPKLTRLGYRVAQIDGSVKDEERVKLRERFKLPKENENALDILLFTEVGSEGLDYQFCDMMINYDLPWNPMRIEQRIGRIDRRGQKSEAVNIYNMITAGTIDATIYYRCLMRIGVFEKCIGDCSAILGEVSKAITEIAFSTELTADEKNAKLEQIADNEVRKVQELQRLEEEEKQLFGFDLSEFTAREEIRAAENPWLMVPFIQKLVNAYLNSRLGEGAYIIGESSIKQIRLSADARSTLYEDCKRLAGEKTPARKKWEAYLRGPEPLHAITFDAASADDARDAFFITIGHPLVRQAAEAFSGDAVQYVSIASDEPDCAPGIYPFELYSWSYRGFKPQSKIVAVCADEAVQDKLMEILQSAQDNGPAAPEAFAEAESLEAMHLKIWEAAKCARKDEASLSAKYRLESLENNFRIRRRKVEQELADATDERILRMKRSELDNIISQYEDKVDAIHQEEQKTDIHTRLLVKGLLTIRK